MLKIIIAVYAKSVTDFKPFVGVFKNGLENNPEAICQLQLDRKDNNAEDGIAGALNAMIYGCLKGQWYEIVFSEEVKIINTAEKKVIFIKPEPYFSFSCLLDRIKF